MGGRARRTAVALAMVAGVLLPACGGSKKSDGLGPTATVPTSSATTTADPYAIPEVIDAAYVNRVLAALDQAMGDIVRTVVGTKSLPKEALERLQSLYVGDYLQLQLDVLQADYRKGFVGYRSQPGNTKTTVSDLISASSECIFARVNRDLSAVAVNPDPRLATQWIGLRAIEKGPVDVREVNPTPWIYVVDGFTSDFSMPENPCVPSA